MTKKITPRGAMIREMREAKGMTQEELAKSLRLTLRQFAKFESSTPLKASNLVLLSLYFGVHIDVITDYTDL